MKFLATEEEMQQIDTISIQQIGIPGLVLMERAALAVTDEIESLIETEQQKKCMGSHKTPEILVVAEKGNNGGDGFGWFIHPAKSSVFGRKQLRLQEPVSHLFSGRDSCVRRRFY